MRIVIPVGIVLGCQYRPAYPLPFIFFGKIKGDLCPGLTINFEFVWSPDSDTGCPPVVWSDYDHFAVYATYDDIAVFDYRIDPGILTVTAEILDGATLVGNYGPITLTINAV